MSEFASPALGAGPAVTEAASMAIAPVPLSTEAVPLGLRLIEEYGLALLFVLFVLEGAMLLVIAPSESLIPFAIALPLASTPAEIALVIGVAVVGATAGQYALFRAAKRGGRDWVLNRRWLPLDESRLDTAERWFDRRGPVVVLVSNSLPFVRGVFTVPAGLSEMDERTFVALSAVGSLSFQTILAGLYLYGGHLLA